MIMARNEDGTYSQVGFVKDNVGIDTEYIYDKDGDIVFEKGFTRETSDTVPLTINGIGKDLKDWSITGNTVQNGTPTPENPVEVQGVGDYDSETGLYRIPVVTRGKNLLEPIGFSAQIITNINDYRIKTNNNGTSLSTVYGGSVLVTQTNQIDTTTSYVNGVFYIVVDFSKFTTGKNYILSFDYEIKEKHSVQGNSIAYIGNSTSPTKIYGDWGKDGRKSATFTVEEGFKPYIAIRLCGNSIFVSNIQIEEGSTATPYEPYHEPITTPIYLPTPLYSGEVIRSDGTITRSDGTTETFTAPQIPTLNGTTVIDVDTAVKPTEMYIKYKSSK